LLFIFLDSVKVISIAERKVARSDLLSSLLGKSSYLQLSQAPLRNTLVSNLICSRVGASAIAAADVVASKGFHVEVGNATPDSVF